MDYTDDKDVLEAFECEHPIRNTCVPASPRSLFLLFQDVPDNARARRYKFSHIQLTKHALASAIKVVRPLSFPPSSLSRGGADTFPFVPLPSTTSMYPLLPQSIRTDQGGLISLQFMIPLSPRGARASVAEGKIGFVEFLVRLGLSPELLSVREDDR